MGEAASTSAYHIAALEDRLMLSVGVKDVSLYDGETWLRII